MKSELMKTNVDSILIQINKQIDKDFQNENSIGVLSGLSGVLLFKYNYAIYSKSSFVNDIVKSIFDEIVNRINQGEVSLTFCSGLAGFGWILNYLNSKTSSLDIDIDQYLEDIDEILIIQMRKDISQSKYDFLHGTMGYGYYFLERFRTTSNVKSKEFYKKYIIEVIDFLNNLAEENDDGIKWPMENNNNLNPEIFNFGLAHGIPSIIFYLTEVYSSGICKSICYRLIVGGIKYISNNKLRESLGFSIFPTGIKVDSDYNIETDSSRLAWCYGDLGIASVILNASIILNDIKLRSEAIAIMNHSAKRLNPKKNFVLDAPICHGAFGIAYIFKKMNHKIQDAKFEESSLYWLNYGMSFYHKNKLDGFKSLNALNNQYNDGLGVLEGLAGIGLVLMSFENNKLNTSWDNCLMLN